MLFTTPVFLSASTLSHRGGEQSLARPPGRSLRSSEDSQRHRAMGKPEPSAIAKATPPLEDPSSLVMQTPVTPAASANTLAWFRPFWPVVPSITRMTSWERPATLLDNPNDLSQFLYKVPFRVKPAGRIHKHQVGISGRADRTAS